MRLFKYMAMMGLLSGLPLTAKAQSNLLFSPVIEAQGVLYLAGQLGYDREAKKFPEGIEAQTRQALDNIGIILKSVDADFDDVVRCQVFLTNPEDFAAMNGVYRTYFSTHPPARTTVAAALVVDAAKIEIECTAVRGHGENKDQ